MNYQELLQETAKEFGTTPQQVDREMRAAIKAAGYDVSPEVFISLTAAKVKNKIKKGRAT